MDLLGSILNSMEAPPDDKEGKKARMKERRAAEKFQEQTRREKAKFRSEIEKKVANFMKDQGEKRLKFEPMDKLQRSIVHDVAEIAGLISHSFGTEEVDKYMILYKKEAPPTEEELHKLKYGEDLVKTRVTEQSNDNTQVVTPVHDYRDKYRHLIGSSSGQEAAVITQPNKSFGYVPSANKRDTRSIEETLNDLRTKKAKLSDHDDVK
ncbi:sperm-associated antigen 7-like [Dysidea avara]|uniref:sperm-associated antigen 7-like n=1 Tax=Dysidea avara TaxID=196820 RepID=UPI00332C2F2A